MELADHEAASERRYHDLKGDIHELKDGVHAKKESYMSTQPLNIFEGGGGGMGAAMGGGLGAGLLGGILGGALLGGNGLLGRNAAGAEFVTPMQLQTATGSIIDANQNTVLLQAVGDVKAAVPLSATQTQLAVSNTASDIRAHLGQVENSLTAGQMAINKNISDAIASSLASQNSINVNVLQSAAATREAINAMGVANLTATANSTKEILAAINDQNIQNLQRQLTVAETALAEQRAEGRARGTEVNVTQTVNQNQMQLQQQQQQQQQAILLNGIWQQLAGLQNAVATNSNMIIGNTGAVGTGPQTANPVNVRT